MSLAGIDAADASDGSAPMTAPPPMTAPAPRPALRRNAARVLGSTCSAASWMAPSRSTSSSVQRSDMWRCSSLPAAVDWVRTRGCGRGIRSYSPALVYRFKVVLRGASCRSAPRDSRARRSTTMPACSEEAVVRDRVCGRLAAVVRDERDGGRPDDPARRVPEEEAPPRHPAEARDPRGGEAEDRDEAPEEHRLPAVPFHDPLGARDHRVRPALQPARSRRKSARPPRRPISQ